jgi:single-strand selective monofunctional uracil DNA glycosylase
MPRRFQSLTDALVADVAPLRFGPPVTHVYNPLVYARAGWDQYLNRCGRPPKEVVLLGMNPGPWGMAQTGVPFGEVATVRDWLGVRAEIGHPLNPHPDRPVDGFDCARSEVSGRRLWGWAQDRFGTPERFYQRFFVANYCPLMFMEESGRNRTPDKLKKAEKAPLFAACDAALHALVDILQPQWVVGVGKFAESRARTALEKHPVSVGGITHPSPANPKANQGWAALIETELSEMGIRMP